MVSAGLQRQEEEERGRRGSGLTLERSRQTRETGRYSSRQVVRPKVP